MHTILECINLRKYLQEHPLEEDKKKKGKRDEEDNDKDEPQGFQLPSNTVNVIYGGDSTFSRCAQKLAWRREILNLEPTIPRPLKYSEVPITFS